MGAWKKYFADGTVYIGSDEDIAAGKASWRTSRNTGIIRVDLEHAGARLGIQGLGQYWQADTYEAVYPAGDHRIIKRCIMKQLEPGEFYFHYKMLPEGVLVDFDKKATGSAQLVPQSSLGKWFVLEMNLKTKQVSHYYKGDCQ